MNAIRSSRVAPVKSSLAMPREGAHGAGESY
jgi:hypothetical protein